MNHDNLRDNIGQAIQDCLAVHWVSPTQSVQLDIFDSRNIDVIADAVIAVLHQHTVQFREFADEADSVLQMVVRTFGDRDKPPKLMEAFATIVMCRKLMEQYGQLPREPQ
jgi:hypothetical protein